MTTSPLLALWALVPCASATTNSFPPAYTYFYLSDRHGRNTKRGRAAQDGRIPISEAQTDIHARLHANDTRQPTT